MNNTQPVDAGLDRHAQDRLVEKLTDIHSWLSEDLDATLIRDTAFRDNSERVSGKRADSEGPMPYDDDAAEAARELHGALREAVWSVCTQRELAWPGERRSPYLALWLTRRIRSLAVCDNATHIATTIIAAHDTAFAAIDTPVRPHFHGYCEMCGQSLWSRGGDTLTCKKCHRVVDTDYQRQLVDTELEGRFFTANELVDVVRDRFKIDIKPKTVHDMAYRRRDRLPVRGRTRDGQKLYRAGDVFHRLRQQQDRRQQRKTS
ncbi:helix-turn-helix DNA binding protein [Gordonia phage Frokostdame]|uniref:Helix-turn-helix DNA binding protein n=1 Tax=Gordonia phage Frokostdame TaxID=2250320 RepID=A0A345L372_9CAUD|nr:helix-turn-helix DNA binding protein [Gordonia phage Frokostdame]AXH49724.1 helix-turn-helix DNA binding protein [Gordonia phage Frokostdame]